MSDVDEAKADPVGQIWDKLDSVHAVMLGSPDHSQHMQPMAPQVARDERAIWFYTRVSSDIAKASVAGGMAHMCVVGDDDWYCCLGGNLQTLHSPAHIERFWNSVVEAWYPGGKDDPELTMLKFTPATGAVWASTSSTLKFGWEIAKANLTGEQPDVGYTAHVVF